MIDTLEINRFKSIKHLELSCRKINLFIGEPNTGKSNILEALGLWSFLSYGRPDGSNARDFFRFERTLNLFYDEVVDEPLAVRCDDVTFFLGQAARHFVGLAAEHFVGLLDESNTNLSTPLEPSGHQVEDSADPRLEALIADHTGVRPVKSILGPLSGKIDRVKFYRFRVRATFDQPRSDCLLPPSGDNLLSLLIARRAIRSAVNDPFRSRGLRLGLRPQENKIEVIKSLEDDIIISHPYSLASETFQRLTFYQAAILSNRDSVLVFEEPESHSFPYHTKFLAEQIALDENGNQYFIATHNPYFLLPVLEKANREDVAVHIVYYEDYQTKTRELAPEDLAELAEVDVFTNLERYLYSQ